MVLLMLLLLTERYMPAHVPVWIVLVNTLLVELAHKAGYIAVLEVGRYNVARKNIPLVDCVPC